MNENVISINKFSKESIIESLKKLKNEIKTKSDTDFNDANIAEMWTSVIQVFSKEHVRVAFKKASQREFFPSLTQFCALIREAEREENPRYSEAKKQAEIIFDIAMGKEDIARKLSTAKNDDQAKQISGLSSVSVAWLKKNYKSIRELIMQFSNVEYRDFRKKEMVKSLTEMYETQGKIQHEKSA